jgi:penicillin-binding protein 1C
MNHPFLSFSRFRRFLLLICVAVFTASFFLALQTSPIAVRLPTAESSISSNAYLTDRLGRALHTIRLNDQERRLEWLPLNKVSPALIRAVLSAEDKNYFSHSGVDVLALVAATGQNVRAVITGGTSKRGASTISMQLAGLLIDESTGISQRSRPRRGVVLKLQQMRTAWEVENSYSKNEILEAYLNTIYFRGEQRGIEAASQAFFAKTAIGLTSHESVVLASLIAAPQAKPALVAQRACRLHNQAFSVSGFDANSDKPCEPLSMPIARLNKPYLQRTEGLVPHVAQRLKAIGLLAPGNTLQTTVDYATQQYAQQSLSEQLRELANKGVEDGAVVVLDNETGHVLAYVGSSGEFSGASHVDAAASLRQAGSTLKPFLYAMAIEKKKLTAASLIDDSSFAIRTADAQYVPRNYSEDYKGWVSVRKALASSLNIPAVRTLAMLDVNEFASSLREIGLSSVSHDGGFYGYSLALGSADVRLIDLTNAYRTLANAGVVSPVRFTSNFPANSDGQRVMSAEAAYIVSDMLRDNEARAATFGLDSALRLPFRASVKTGTSKDMRDNWCIGYSDRYTVGVWVGNASGAPMRGVSGVSGAAPIWNSVMRFVHNGVAMHSERTPPSKVIAQPISFVGVAEPERVELFLDGTQTAEIRLVSQKKRATALISYPVHGAIYALDPDIPSSKQRLRFSAGSFSIHNTQWQLNGKIIPSNDWRLVPGRHVLALLNQRGEVLERVKFEVRGRQ